MSVAVQFPSLKRLRDFVRRTAHPDTPYRWQQEDRVLIRKATRRERREGRGDQAWVWMPKAPFEDPSLATLCNRLGVERSPELPDAAAEATMTMTLDELLQRSMLMRPNANGAPSKTARRDIIVALYNVPHSMADGAFASVVKNPHAPATVLFLDGEPSRSQPSTLIQVPQSDALIHSGVWLEAERRRLAPHDGEVRLFQKWSSGDLEVYVEYPYLHSFVPELGHLYSNADHASLLLIRAAADTPADHVSSDWCLIRPADIELVERLDAGEGVDLVVDLEGGVHTQFAHESTGNPTLQVRSRVEPLFARGGARMENLNQQIQGTKTQLARLEQQRAELLGRVRRPVKFVLRFQQPAAGDGTPHLAPNFEKFLLMSRFQLDEFDYQFQDGPGDEQYHVVVTQNPVLMQEIHRGLADEAYYQLPDWQTWGLPIFVREDCRLVPQIDSKDVAQQLNAALERATQQSTADKLLLVHGGGPHGDHWNVLALQASRLERLDRRQEFINTEYPMIELESRAQARGELLAAAKLQQVDLEKQIRAIEQNFKDRATARLKRAQQLWNTLAENLERAAVQICALDDRLNTLEEILRDFAVSWVAFLNEALLVNRELIAGKLDALDLLEHRTKEWKTRLEEVDRGNLELTRILPPLKDEIDTRVTAAEKQFDRARVLYEEVRAYQQAALTQLKKLVRKAAVMLEEMHKETRRVRKIEGDYREKTEAIQNLNANLAELCEKLAQHIELLNLQHERSRELADQIEGRHSQLVNKKEELDKHKEMTARQFQEALELIEAIQQQHQEQRADVEEKNKELQRQQAELKALAESLEAAIVELQRRRDESREERAAIAERTREFHHQTDLLAEEADRLAEDEKALADAQRNHEQQRATLKQAADRIRERLKQVDDESSARLDALLADIDETIRGLGALAELEVQVRPLDGFFRAVRMQEKSAAEFRNSLAVDARKQKRIWRTTESTRRDT